MLIFGETFLGLLTLYIVCVIIYFLFKSFWRKINDASVSSSVVKKELERKIENLKTEKYDAMMSIMDGFRKYEVTVDTRYSNIVEYFEKKKWLEGDKPVIMASILADGNLCAFNSDTMHVYFPYSNPEIMSKFKEGYTGLIAVTGSRINGNQIKVDMWVKFVDSKLNEESVTLQY